MLEELATLKAPVQAVNPRHKMNWERPDEGWVKVNIDAAFDSNMSTGSTGVVIRDHMG
jgi:hypothetical protein